MTSPSIDGFFQIQIRRLGDVSSSQRHISPVFFDKSVRFVFRMTKMHEESLIRAFENCVSAVWRMGKEIDVLSSLFGFEERVGNT